jgi:hypothetical protein
MARGSIVIASWTSVGLFVVAAGAGWLGGSDVEDAVAVFSLGLFLVSLVVWAVALGIAFTRSARGDDITVPGLFLLGGPGPRAVRWHLYGALGVSVLVAIVTGSENPFGWLVPMLPLGFVGLWGARHGTYPPRRPPPNRPPVVAKGVRR